VQPEHEVGCTYGERQRWKTSIYNEERQMQAGLVVARLPRALSFAWESMGVLEHNLSVLLGIVNIFFSKNKPTRRNISGSARRHPRGIRMQGKNTPLQPHSQ